MKISKALWIDEGVKWSPIRKYQMLKHHQYKGKVYIICTSPIAHWLFEVIEAKDLSSRYAACYVLGIAETKQGAIEYLTRLIDALYNTGSITYEALIT